MRYIKMLVAAGLVIITFFYGCGKKDAHRLDYAYESEKSERYREEFTGEKVNGVREIRLEAFQFGFKPETIVVQKGERLRIIAKSTDVAHGLEIEKYNINQILPPEEEKSIEFIADKTGKFHFHCSVYCGTGHGDMHGVLIVKE